MSGSKLRNARAELRARGQVQSCWSCGKQLLATAPYRHPQFITLGHYTALEDLPPGADPYDPNGYGPQCMACNYGDGARRTNAHRAGRPYQSIRNSWVNDDF